MIYMYNVNYLHILVAAVVAMIAGYLWYSPYLFGNQWAKLSGMKMDGGSKQDMQKTYGISYLLAVVTAYMMSYFIGYLQVTTFMGAVQLAFMLWLGFAMPPMATNYLFKKTSQQLFFLETGHVLFAMVAIAVTLVLWV